MLLRTLLCYSLLTVSLILNGCSGVPGKPSLYQQLGGEQGVEQLVDAFIGAIAADDQIFHYFAEANVTHFRQGFITHICDISGGPCQYTGDSMVDIHTGMHINEADFNRVVELLVEAMEQVGISYPVQNRLLARLAPLRKDIIHI